MNAVARLLALVALGTMLVACDESDPGRAPAGNQAPQAILVVQGDIRPAVDGGGVNVTLGSALLLSGDTSTDPDGDSLQTSWTLVSAPAGSGTVLSSTTAASVTMTPDQMGIYVVRLDVVDSLGASGSQELTVTVDNHAPAANIQVAVTFAPTPIVAAPQEMTVGGSVLIDASASTDPDGDPLTTSFTVLERPATSLASLQVTDTPPSARLLVDVAGTYRVQVEGADAFGASYLATYEFHATNNAPQAVVVTTIDPVVANSGSSSINASVGYNILLSSSASTDPGGAITQRNWQLLSRPATSTATLGTPTATTTLLTPDVLGAYVVQLTVSDASGAQAIYTTTVNANNTRPAASISTNATPNALPNAPAVLIPLGNSLTLRSNSFDAEGDTLTYLWSILSRPAGGTATLSSTSAQNPSLVPDAEGAWVIRLRVTDTSGAYSERQIQVNVGTSAPVAMIDRTRLTVVAGTMTGATAALSYDEDGDALTYSWALDSQPASSSATLASTTPAMTFTPDIPGVYVVSVTVNDGRALSVAYLTIRALDQASSIVELPFVPGKAVYSSGLDRVVITATNPDAIYVLDPFTGAKPSVPMPLPIKNLRLSPNGLLAAVLHDGKVSLVDLQTLAIIRTSDVLGARTDAFVTNDGYIYAIGQTGGQWVSPAVYVVNGYNGVAVTGSVYGALYGTQWGVFADKLNKVFLLEQGLSPADIHYFQISATTRAVTAFGDTPYHGDYSMGSTLYLNENQSLVFTSYGNYFRTDTLTYAGAFSGVTSVASFSQSALADEVLLLVGGSNYPASYKYYSGALFSPQPDLALPLINGLQSYGIRLFHSSAAYHVVMVQTGSASPTGPGLTYYVIVR